MTTLSVAPVAPTTISSARWNAFLSLLAVAENAAAQQFTLIAKALHDQGHFEPARWYRDMAREEVGHFERVSRAYREYLPPSASVLGLYSGDHAPASPFVERMAVAHLAQETAALAFLGYIHGHVHDLMEDVAWADQLRTLCAGILREEVVHVKNGSDYVAHFLQGYSDAARAKVCSAVRLHKSMVIRTVRGIFRGAGVGFFVDAMLANYDRRCKSATGDLFGDPR